MSTTHVPHPAPRDIEGNEAATLVKCPDCLAAVFNLRHQRQAHLKWHDDLDADVADAQNAAHAAQTAAESAERALGEARREIAELRRELSEATGSTTPLTPLVGDWPEDELAEHEAAHGSAAPVYSPPDDDDPDAVDLPVRRW
jgi:hypothetical protein